MQLEDVLSPDQIDLLRSKQKELEEQEARITQNLRHGGKQAMQGSSASEFPLALRFSLEYVRNLEQLSERYTREEEDHRQRNDAKKADLALKKKNIVVKEVSIFAVTALTSTDFHFRLKHSRSH